MVCALQLSISGAADTVHYRSRMSDGHFVFPARILNEDETTRHGIWPLALFHFFGHDMIFAEILLTTVDMLGQIGLIHLINQSFCHS